MKLLVTHFAPDLDAIASCWLLKRFDARTYADAKMAFVNPGESIDLRVASDMGFSPEDITHTDTGLGIFDHHQPDRGMQRVCATTLVYDYVCSIHPDYKADKALAYIAEYVNVVDHFEENFWKDADDLKYQFLLQNVLDGVRMVGLHDNEALFHFGCTCLDGVYAAIKEQVSAEEEIAAHGSEFVSRWGRSLAIASSNDEVIKLAQKRGFSLVIRKDPTLGNIRIKAVPGKSIDLTPLYEAIIAEDKVGNWYFHPAKTMLLNGSSKRQDHKPSPLTLDRVVELSK